MEFNVFVKRLSFDTKPACGKFHCYRRNIISVKSVKNVLNVTGKNGQEHIDSLRFKRL